MLEILFSWTGIRDVSLIWLVSVLVYAILVCALPESIVPGQLTETGTSRFRFLKTFRIWLFCLSSFTWVQIAAVSAATLYAWFTSDVLIHILKFSSVIRSN